MKTSIPLTCPRQKWTIWCGFGCAILIHLLAIRLATGHVEAPPTLTVCPPFSRAVELEAEPQPPDPPESEVLHPAVSPDTEFVDERVPPIVRPVREQKPVRMMKPVSQSPASFGAAKTFAIQAPRPAYPYEARRRNITGAGTVMLTIDSASGRVADATMSQSIGNAILDEVTISTLRRWQFRSGCPTRVRVPITFTLSGAVY